MFSSSSLFSYRQSPYPPQKKVEKKDENVLRPLKHVSNSFWYLFSFRNHITKLCVGRGGGGGERKYRQKEQSVATLFTDIVDVFSQSDPSLWASALTNADFEET